MVLTLELSPPLTVGDLPTALGMLILKRLTGVSMYTEVQVMDERRRALVIANSGEGTASRATASPQFSQRSMIWSSREP